MGWRVDVTLEVIIFKLSDKHAWEVQNSNGATSIQSPIRIWKLLQHKLTRLSETASSTAELWFPLCPQPES